LMYVERLLYPVTTLGPGNRVVLWLEGCSKHCWGCANPEMWETESTSDLSESHVANILKQLCKEQGAHRITFTGGVPLEQPEQLATLLELIRPEFDDVLVYTGYELDEARSIVSPSIMSRIESNIDVLIDGPYMDELNDGLSSLRGSTNQVIHYFNPTVEKQYETYLENGRSVMNVVSNGKIVSVGIHNREVLADRNEHQIEEAYRE